MRDCYPADVSIIPQSTYLYGSTYLYASLGPDYVGELTHLLLISGSVSCLVAAVKSFVKTLCDYVAQANPL